MGVLACSFFSFLFFCVFLFFMLLSSSSWPFINLASLFITTGDAYFLSFSSSGDPTTRTAEALRRRREAQRETWSDLGKMVTPLDRDGGCCCWLVVVALYRFSLFAWLLRNDYLPRQKKREAKRKRGRMSE